MSDKTRAAMQKALNLIEGEWPEDDEIAQSVINEIREALAEQALQKLLDFHQSIEHDGHWSDCSTHNEPAYPNGECDCGGYPAEQEPVAWMHKCGDVCSAYDKEHMFGLDYFNIPLYAAPQPDMNLSCKSVQKRLAASWGYVQTVKDEVELADDEIAKEMQKLGYGHTPTNDELKFAHAIIAAYREKNK